MSDERKDGLDRRDFMVATIASVGASAVLAANTSCCECPRHNSARQPLQHRSPHKERSTLVT